MCTRLAAWLAAVSLASGCSLILDTNDLPKNVDGPPQPMFDAPPDARYADANPINLHLDSADPAVIDEGVGTDGGRPAVVTIEAGDLLASATVEVAWVDTGTPDGVMIETSVVSGGRMKIALALRVPVNDLQPEGVMRPLRITATQMVGGMPVSADLDIMVRGHDELDLVAPTNLDTTLPAYAPDVVRSRITIADGITVTASGLNPLYLTSIGELRIDGVLDASATGAGPGPGGCVGGVPGAGGGCTQGAGGGGIAAAPMSAGSGGGGSYGTMGTGNAGAVTGNPPLVPLGFLTDHPENRGHGGAGGATGALGAGNPGRGGHGGGTVVLVAGGAVHVGANGRVLANGEPGVNDSSLNVAGDGGGGSGGAILIRSTAAIDAMPTVPWAIAIGLNQPAQSTAGKGGNGRIRIDTPIGAVGPMGNPAATLGPTWKTPEVLVTGDSGHVEL
jgi:hypothetical protein